MGSRIDFCPARRRLGTKAEQWAASWRRERMAAEEGISRKPHHLRSMPPSPTPAASPNSGRTGVTLLSAPARKRREMARTVVRGEW
jgi:hypothetical protein